MEDDTFLNDNLSYMEELFVWLRTGNTRQLLSNYSDCRIDEFLQKCRKLFSTYLQNEIDEAMNFRIRSRCNRKENIKVQDSPQLDKHCYYCGRTGHVLKYCRALLRQCYACGSNLHFLRQCHLYASMKNVDNRPTTSDSESVPVTAFSRESNPCIKKNARTQCWRGNKNSEKLSETCFQIQVQDSEGYSRKESHFETRNRYEQLTDEYVEETSESKHERETEVRDDVKFVEKLKTTGKKRPGNLFQMPQSKNISVVNANSESKSKLLEESAVVDGSSVVPCANANIGQSACVGGDDTASLGVRQNVDAACFDINNDQSDVDLDGDSNSKNTKSESIWVTKDTRKTFEKMRKRLQQKKKLFEIPKQDMDNLPLPNSLDWSFDNEPNEELLNTTTTAAGLVSTATQTFSESKLDHKIKVLPNDSGKLEPGASTSVIVQISFLVWLRNSLQEQLDNIERIKTISRWRKDSWVNDITDVLSEKNSDKYVRGNTDNRTDVLGNISGRLDNLVTCITDLINNDTDEWKPKFLNESNSDTLENVQISNDQNDASPIPQPNSEKKFDIIVPPFKYTSAFTFLD